MIFFAVSVKWQASLRNYLPTFLFLDVYFLLSWIIANFFNNMLGTHTCNFISLSQNNIFFRNLITSKTKRNNLYFSLFILITIFLYEIYYFRNFKYNRTLYNQFFYSICSSVTFIPEPTGP